MREVMLNSGKLLDLQAISYIQSCCGRGLLNCAWIRFNEKIKVAYFTRGYRPITEKPEHMEDRDLCRVARSLLHQVMLLEKQSGMSPENLILDPDSIYVNDKGWTGFIYIPAELPDPIVAGTGFESQENEKNAAGPIGRPAPVYMKRVYSVLEELLLHGHADPALREGFLQQEAQYYGDWNSLDRYLKTCSGTEEDPEEWTPEVMEEPDRPQQEPKPAVTAENFDAELEIKEISQVHIDLKEQIDDEEKPFVEDTEEIQEKLLQELQATLRGLEE